MPLTPFHLAVQVRDIPEARAFYGQLLGCKEGRNADTWVDFIIEPYIRFKGQPGEQATMFFKDPSGNALDGNHIVNTSRARQ